MAQDDVSSGPAHPLIESDHVEGTAVYDASGKRIGTIKRLVIEKVSGHVVYAVTALLPGLRRGNTYNPLGTAALRLRAPCAPSASCPRLPPRILTESLENAEHKP